MLILEGSDLVGKTTLAKKLLEHKWMRENGYVFKAFSKTPPGFHHLHDHLANAVRKSVQDRFHMSNVAYRHATGEQQNTCPEEYRQVDGSLRAWGAFTVVVTADDELLRERYAELGAREMYPLEIVLRANEWFFRAAKSKRWNGFELDVDQHVHCTAADPWPAADAEWFQRYVIRQLYVVREGLCS